MRAEQDSDPDVLSWRQVLRFCHMEVGCQVGVLDLGGTKGDTEEVREAQSMGTESWGRRWGDRGPGQRSGNEDGSGVKGQRRRGLQGKRLGVAGQQATMGGNGLGDPLGIGTFPSWRYLQHQVRVAKGQKGSVVGRGEKSINTTASSHFRASHCGGNTPRHAEPESRFSSFWDGMYL